MKRRYTLIPTEEIVRETIKVERQRTAPEMVALREEATHLREENARLRRLVDALLELDRLRRRDVS